MTTQPKRMLVHKCDLNGEWQSQEYSSVRDMLRALRSKHIRCKTMDICSLENDSVVLIQDGMVIEIEEAIDTGRELEFKGVTYIPVKEWAITNNSTVRKARYAYSNKKLEGMSVGRHNYLYIRKDR